MLELHAYDMTNSNLEVRNGSNVGYGEQRPWLFLSYYYRIG